MSVPAAPGGVKVVKQAGAAVVQAWGAGGNVAAAASTPLENVIVAAAARRPSARAKAPYRWLMRVVWARDMAALRFENVDGVQKTLALMDAVRKRYRLSDVQSAPHQQSGRSAAW